MMQEVGSFGKLTWALAPHPIAVPPGQAGRRDARRPFRPRRKLNNNESSFQSCM
jgi:hypothetical protein